MAGLRERVAYSLSGFKEKRATLHAEYQAKLAALDSLETVIRDMYAHISDEFDSAITRADKLDVVDLDALIPDVPEPPPDERRP